MHARTGASTRVRTCTLMQAAAPSSSLHTSIVPPSSLTSTSTSARPRRTARRLSSRCDLISSSSSVARCAKAAPRERTHVVSARTSAHAHAHAHAHARTPMRTPTCACTCLAASSAAVCASPDDAELARRSRSSARAPSSDCSVASSLACTSEHTWCETATCPCPCAHAHAPMRPCPCLSPCVRAHVCPHAHAVAPAHVLCVWCTCVLECSPSAFSSCCSSDDALNSNTCIARARCSEPSAQGQRSSVLRRTPGV